MIAARLAAALGCDRRSNRSWPARTVAAAGASPLGGGGAAVYQTAAAEISRESVRSGLTPALTPNGPASAARLISTRYAADRTVRPPLGARP